MNKTIRKILVVDDETSNIDALARILLPTYEVFVAKNGKTAVERALSLSPDIILLDVILPDMTGFDVIVKLKSMDSTMRIPVIFITGLDSRENEAKGLMLGAVDYITKPFINSIVLARVHTHVKIVEYISTIERLTQVDGLTNIANRRSFDQQMGMEWDRSVRNKTPISFMMIDIDRFKNYNDTYGHPQGDTLLKAMALVFQNSLYRSTDFVARYGGEEFAILLPGVDEEGALDVAERIRANVEYTVVPCVDGTHTSVTVSIGLVTDNPDQSDIGNAKEFISRADKALYEAKNTGRNRVCTADDNNLL